VDEGKKGGGKESVGEKAKEGAIAVTAGGAVCGKTAVRESGAVCGRKAVTAGGEVSSKVSDSEKQLTEKVDDSEYATDCKRCGDLKKLAEIGGEREKRRESEHFGEIEGMKSGGDETKFRVKKSEECWKTGVSRR
jgi:hypothetical protein